MTGVSLELNTVSQTLHIYIGRRIYADFEYVRSVDGDRVDYKGDKLFFKRTGSFS